MHQSLFSKVLQWNIFIKQNLIFWTSFDPFGNLVFRIFSDLEFFVHFIAILVEFSDRILVVLGLDYQNDFAEK